MSTCYKNFSPSYLTLYVVNELWYDILKEGVIALPEADLTGARYEIFKTAINLFSKNSYESVTLEDITAKRKRTPSSFYHHFKSKQDILDCMYIFFKAHFFDQRKTLDELKPIFETGSVLDMMLAMLFKFPPEHADILTKILDVLHQRKYFDEEARIIIQEMLIEEGERYVEEAFNYAIQIGRLAPFNTSWLSTVINDVANGEYLRAISDKSHNYHAYVSEKVLVIFQHLAALIKDLRPPINPDAALYNER